MRVAVTILALALALIGSINACAPSDSSDLLIVQTGRNGDRHREMLPVVNDAAPDAALTVDTLHPRQELLGFGASFTESSAWNLACLPAAQRTAILTRLFSPDEGMGFSLARTHINSCDYSLRHYAYSEPYDFSLRSFSVDEDLAGFTGDECDEVRGVALEDPGFDLLPMIRAALAVPGAKFRLVASPWSPPSWMKENEHGEMTGGYLRRDMDGNGKLVYYELWARYLVEYAEAYLRLNIPLWALTPQNEPGHADGARWDTCWWSAEWQREFIADYLGPELADAGLLRTYDMEQGLNLLAFDHNKADVLDFAPVILDDPRAAQYVRGTAIHWYAINLDGRQDFRGEALAELRERYPDKLILHTESSIDLHPDDPVGQYWDPENEDWTRGRFTPFSQYAIDIITDLNHGAAGYIDWCMVLSSTGGPNPYGNFNSAPVLVDPEADTVLYTPLFWLLGHFSKYVRPGAVLLPVEGEMPGDVHAAAARNPDGSIAVVVFNDAEEARTVAVRIDGETITTIVAGDALQTIVVRSGRP